MVNNAAAARLIAERLPAGLVHPGDGSTKPTPIPLPGLASTGIPPEQAKHFARQAGLPAGNAPTLIGEAIVHLLETELDGGSTIIANTELAALRQAAADAPSGIRTIALHCQCDRTQSDPLLELRIGKTDKTIINAKPLLAALHARSVDCPHPIINS